MTSGDTKVPDDDAMDPSSESDFSLSDSDNDLTGHICKSDHYNIMLNIVQYVI